MTWKVDHRNGIATVYATSIALGLFGVLAPLLEFGRTVFLSAGLFLFEARNPSVYVQTFALVLAVVIVYAAERSMARQRKRRAAEMRDQTVRAVARIQDSAWPGLPDDDLLVEICAKLSGEKPDTVRARLRFYGTLSPEALSTYILPGSDVQEAAQLLALITDLPARWIADCATNRRGSVRETVRIAGGRNDK